MSDRQPTVKVMIIEAGDGQVWGPDSQPLPAGAELECSEDVAAELVAKQFATRLARK